MFLKNEVTGTKKTLKKKRLKIVLFGYYDFNFTLFTIISTMSILSIKKYFVAETVARFLVCLFPKVEKFNISAMYKSIFLIK